MGSVITPIPASQWPLKRGIFIQTYRAKIPGATHAARMKTLDAKMAEWKTAGVVGVGMHGFSEELPAAMPELIGMCQKRQMDCLGMFGLDATDPIGKGKRMASVGNMPGCGGVGVDAEGAYDIGKQQVALDMGKAFRADAPKAFVADQSWPVPTLHSSFPYEQFAGFTDAYGKYIEFVDVHAEQKYYNDFARQYGLARYEKCEAWFETSEARLETILPAKARRPHVLTIQGYGWSDIPYKCVKCVVTHESMFVWSEWYPEPTFMHAAQARQRLDQKVGLYVNGVWSGDDAVLRFQKKYNLTASTKLSEDGVYGPKTDAALFQNGTMTAVGRVFSKAFWMTAK